MPYDLDSFNQILSAYKPLRMNPNALAVQPRPTGAVGRRYAGGGGFSGAVESGDVQNRVHAVARRLGIPDDQLDELDWIIRRESGWNPNAANKRSSARGLFQKMTSIHGPIENSVEGQANWGLNYILRRYGSPAGAQAFWRRRGWY